MYVCERATCVMSEVLLAMCSTRFVLCARLFEKNRSLCVSLWSALGTRPTGWLYVHAADVQHTARNDLAPKLGSLSSPFYIPFFKHDSLSLRRWFLSRTRRCWCVSLSGAPLLSLPIYIGAWFDKWAWCLSTIICVLKSNTPCVIGCLPTASFWLRHLCKFSNELT